MTAATGNRTTSAVGDRGRHFGSFREYVEALKAIGEVQDIDREVDWNLEMGAIIMRTTQNKLPAPLFNKVKDTEPGLRALGAPAAASRQPGLYFARLALMMGLDPHAGGLELVEAYLAAKTRPILPPLLVNKEKAPCKQHIWSGDDIDLTRLPAPYIHDGDGGRVHPDRGHQRRPLARWQVDQLVH